MSKSKTGLTYLIGFGIVIGGTAAVKGLIKLNQAIEKLKYEIIAFKIHNGNWFDMLVQGIPCTISLKLINESDKTIPFKSLRWDIYLEDYFITTVRIEDGKPIPKQSSIKMDVNFNITILSIAGGAQKLFKSIVEENKTVPVRVVGEIKTGSLTIPVNEELTAGIDQQKIKQEQMFIKSSIIQ